MSVLIQDTGFVTDHWIDGFQAWDDTLLSQWDHPAGYAIDMPNTANPADLVPFFKECAMIRIAFPNSADGRGFSLARHLRLLGYTGRLRANGHVLADQYAMARRVGFDEVEVHDEIAARQPADQWRARADWREHDYLGRLQQSA